PHVREVYPLGGRRGEKARFALSGAGVDGESVEVTLPNEVGLREVRFGCKAGQSQPVGLDVDDLPEVLEGGAKTVAWPAVANGRIAGPGEVDGWRTPGRRGEPVQVELRAASLGSPLQGMIEVADEAGKVVQTAEYATADPALLFTPAKDGEYVVRVR